MSPNRILLKPEIFSEDFVPGLVHGRKEQVERLARCLAPALSQAKPLHSLLVGPSGSGKTLVARSCLGRIADQGVSSVHLNCWENDSLYSIMDRIVRELGVLGAEKIDTAFKIQAIQRHLGKRPLAVVLDEVHQLPPRERNAVIYNLLRLGNTGLVCISHDPHFLHSLEDSVLTRLYPTEIRFEPYDSQALTEIVRSRCSTGLASGVVADSHLRYVASKAAGNARIALQIIQKAASLAEQDRCNKLTRKHLTEATISHNGTRRDYVLSLHNEHFRMIHDLIKEHLGILSGRLWKTYNQRSASEGKTPVAHRTFSAYVRKLCQLSLVVAERVNARGNVRSFRLAE